MSRRLAVVLGLVLLGLSAPPWGRGARDLPAAAAPRPAYVEDRTCAGCHAPQYGRWLSSHHARAMQRADDSTVVGDFGGATFADRGQTIRFFRRDGRFMVTAEGPDGRPADFEVRYTFGVEPLQQYLVEFPGGRLQVPSVATETATRRWFAITPDRRFALDDPRHWTGRYQTWNLMCAECHSTNLRKGYDPERDAYRTAWDALSVGCQACHGPGAAHVAWARAGGARRDGAARGAGLVVDFTAGSAQDQVDSCARCHARRVRLVEEEHPGRPLLDDFRPQLLRADLYFPDGQQRGEVFEYGSFRQTAMYRRGVRCTDCHDPHAATLRAEGNAVCTRCHRAERGRDYDAPAHHFHRPGSPAAACVACHMPARTYMGVDARRDHRFPVPRPDLTAKLGTPNACSGCHTDRPPEWAEDALRRWYGPRKPGGDSAETLAAGRAGARDAAPRLAALAADPAQAAIVRATALDLLREYGTAGVPAMLAALGDADPVVRLAAVAGLDVLAPAERVRAVAPLLRDPIRAVRVEAARVLAPVPREALAAAQRRALEAALAELRASLAAMADMPATHVDAGLLHEALGERDLAEKAYERALRMDPYSVRARTSLARFLRGSGRPDRAEGVLREGLRRTPDSGDLHHALGLLLAERGRAAEAADALGRAARLMPGRARVLYNYGVALQDAGRPAEAETALREADGLDPADGDVVYALAILALERGDPERATAYAKRLMDLAPGDSRTRGLAARLGITAPGR